MVDKVDNWQFTLPSEYKLDVVFKPDDNVSYGFPVSTRMIPVDTLWCETSFGASLQLFIGIMTALGLHLLK